MAEAAHTASPPSRAWPSLTPSPPVAHAIRFAVATCAALWLGKQPGLVENNSQWILITVVIVFQPTAGGALKKGLLRAVGTAAAFATSIALFGLFAQDPPLLMAALFAIQVVAAYGFTGTRNPYAWFVWAFTTAIVLGDALSGTGDVETVAFERASMVGMGLLIVFVADALLWPQRAEPQLRRSLAVRARRLGTNLRRVLAGEDARPSAAGELAAQLGLVEATGTEIGISRARRERLSRLVLLLEAMKGRVRSLAIPPELPPRLPADVAEERRGFEDAARALAGQIDAALGELARALEAGRPTPPQTPRLDAPLLELESARERLVARGVASSALEGRVADLRELLLLLRTVESLETPTDSTRPAPEGASLKGLHLDPFRTKIALRAGIAVIAVIVLMLALGWPVNMLVAPTAFIIAAIPTRGGALLTFVLMLAVIAVGWTVADLLTAFVTRDLGRMPLALVPAFAVAAVYGYFAARRPQLALLQSIGSQVTFLSAFGGSHASTDVYGAYNTVSYMVLASIVGWAATRVLWPATASGLFRQRVAAYLEQLREDFLRALRENEAERLARARELVRGAVAEAAALGPLHVQADHEPLDEALDAERRGALLGLTTDLTEALVVERPDGFACLSRSDEEPVVTVREALAREEEALLASLDGAAAALRDGAEPPGPELAAAQRAVLDGVEAMRERTAFFEDLEAADQRSLLLAYGARRRLVSRQLALEAWLTEWRADADQLPSSIAARHSSER